MTSVLLPLAACTGERTTASTGATTTVAPAITSTSVAASGQSTTSSSAAPTTLDVPSLPLTTVVLLGDSLMWETSPYLVQLLGGRQVLDRSFGGTAPCDGLFIDPPVDASTLVVVSFIGNSFTPCMTDANGELLGGDALVEKYRVDLDTLVARFLAGGASVLLLGQPTRADHVDKAEQAEAINAYYRFLAEQPGVHFVDAGAAVENSDGSFATSLPCLPDEPECGPDGRNPVRTGDLLHFCPTGAEFTGCDVYSSGAYRYALAIVAAIDAL